MDWLLRLIIPADQLPEGSREWTFATEGIPMGWAFLLLLVLGALTLWAYRKFAPDVPKKWRVVMATLRIIIIAIFLFLLAKPVLHLTINEPVRQSLLVLLDSSQSMALEDRRTTPDDLVRAGIADGTLDPSRGLKQSAPEGPQAIKRWDLLEKLAANQKLNLWPRLQEKSDVVVYRFGRDATQAGTLTPENSQAGLTTPEAEKFFKGIKPEEPASAIGESLRQVLEQNRGQAVAGILLITDMANNSGLPPGEAARMAKEANIPLFIYGMGVASPVDLIVRELNTPRLAFVKERVDVKVKLTAQGVGRRTVTATLKANGQPVNEQKIDLVEDGDYEIDFHFVPEEVGDLQLEASVPVFDEEIGKDNNRVEGKLRVVDNKIHVLFIDQEPRWDFRYLLAFLQRDRRLEVKCVLIDGEPDLDKIPDSPFLPGLPEDRDGIFKQEIIILGDVSPTDLGETRMKLIREWVEQAGGGIIFLAGPKFDPFAYEGTPLEALLPVIPDTSLTAEQRTARAKEPFPLKLTPAGEISSYLRVEDDPEKNLQRWNSFPGVRWTAAVAKAKPGAEVLLADSRTERAGINGPMPVIAIQGYGSGESVYIGTDETYRWRSRTGEKDYSQIWGAIMQAMSLRRLEGASSRTQLKAERERYFVGDKVVLAGKMFKEGFEALTAASVEGRLKILSTGPDGKPVEKVIPLAVSAIEGQPGEYRAEFTAENPGHYSYSTLQDPEATVKFEIIEPKVEQMETAMNERLAKVMAESGKGKFLREEDLNALPDMVAEQSATVASFRKVDLFHSLWWMTLLLVLLFAEWLIRRLMQLK